ncbi:putative transcriptional regulator [Paenibacillus phyllosphaerae]|uniref:Putative transcriptional regulator n=1 Tax=Paenibacillus phyllosphaerae TaxID=274593 RepID=A0A7W5AZT8_9BACL|nr:helix-turn-helix domain-containing protein [Paenibacillus phyllosphaerae]MBB3111828.1 putative transcriptional regulator [Paenibacillus phyllosphaerae]
MHIQVSTKYMNLLECFSSETRVRMIELLDERPMSIKELAETLEISSAIVTKHIQKMEEGGIIATQSLAGTRGSPKICSLAVDALTLQLRSPKVHEEMTKYSVEIPVGQYSDYAVKPTCGLASETKILGLVDDPRYFSDPERTKAAHLWFGSGFVEYRIPNYLHAGQEVQGIEISLELCSEAPYYNEDWPSDISFLLNDIEVGMWTCPGDFGSKRALLTPSWWQIGTQNGLLKTLSVQESGTYLDGTRLSDVTVQDLGIVRGEDFRLKLVSDEKARHCGGISLFGKQFGNYNQDIVVHVHYKDVSRSTERMSEAQVSQ